MALEHRNGAIDFSPKDYAFMGENAEFDPDQRVWEDVRDIRPALSERFGAHFTKLAVIRMGGTTEFQVRTKKEYRFGDVLDKLDRFVGEEKAPEDEQDQPDDRNKSASIIRDHEPERCLIIEKLPREQGFFVVLMDPAEDLWSSRHYNKEELHKRFGVAPKSNLPDEGILFQGTLDTSRRDGVVDFYLETEEARDLPYATHAGIQARNAFSHINNLGRYILGAGAERTESR